MLGSKNRSESQSDLAVDLTTTIGSVTLPGPVMTASGTSGHSDELAAFFDLSDLGAVVVKSLASFVCEGNAAPRIHQTAAGMINSVGLQGPGVEAWRREELPALARSGARVVASIWGRTVDDYRTAASQLAGVEGVVAVEVNISCPNVEDGKRVFAHDPAMAAAAIEATAPCGLPRWAKLSPNVTDIAEIAGAVFSAGAEAVTLANTVMGLVIDIESGRPVLGGGGGGMSGPGIRPVAVRAVYETRAAHPDLPIIGVGGIATAEHAVEFLMAGANAVQVGTATFADPRASNLVQAGLVQWCQSHGVESVSQLVGVAHDS